MTKEEAIAAFWAEVDPRSIPTLEQIEQEIARRRLERERKLQSRRGWYDKNGVRQGGLMAFIRYFWKVLEPGTELVEGWALWAIVEHLEAVTFGEIDRLLMNVPPGFSKSLSTDVFWPAFEWGPMGMPHLRYVAFSYADDLTVRDNNRFRDLMLSWEYQQMWGDKFGITKTGERKIENDRTGWKFASSVGGVGTGERGDRIICDDLHNVLTAESKVVRERATRWFREVMQSRLNDPVNGVIVVIMQRTHEDDVSGVILERKMPYVHLMIPMEYDPTRHCETAIGWSDPRTEEGEIADPIRFPPNKLKQLKTDLGAYAVASQLQQEPAPRSGVIFVRDYWQVYECTCKTPFIDPGTNLPIPCEAKAIADHEPGQWPSLEYVIGVVDGAYTEEEENDPSAMVVLGVFRDGIERPKIGLRHAWRKRLPIHGPMIERKEGESEIAYTRRCQPYWGLVEWVAYTSTRFRVETLLIEAKASGISAAQSIQSLYVDASWSTILEKVAGDKEARAKSVVPIFSNKMVYVPAAAKQEQTIEGNILLRDYAEMTVTEMALFPKGRYDDLTDCVVHGLRYLRRCGYAKTPSEVEHEQQEAAKFRPRRRAPFYPGMRRVG